MATSLHEFDQQLTDLVARASASVVGVSRAGSGVIVAEGLVVTNAHNLRDEVHVYFGDEPAVTAAVAGADVDGDLAVVAVGTGGRPSLGWAPGEDEVQLGQLVVGLSRPGGRALRVGVGSVSALGLSFRGPEGSTVTGAIEHSAPLARGSSGGPLIGSDGRLAGINTHRVGDGFYLALPAGTELQQRVEALARGEAPPRRPRLGVALTPPRAARHLRNAVGLPPRDGLLVQAVDSAGPAGRAGIRSGDLIVSVGGEAVTSVDELARALQAAGASGTAELVVVRGVDEITVAVRFDQTGPAEQGSA